MVKILMTSEKSSEKVAQMKKTFYTKVVEDLITNLMPEQPSRTDL
jgi:hypothetical protein